MSWRPDQQTQESIEGMVDALFAVAPDVLGIDEFIAGCEVSNMDLYGVGLGVYPRYIQCDIKGYQQPVFYRGGLATLAVGDDVTVVHIRDGELYEVAGPSGSTGTAGLTGTGLNTQVTYWTGPNTIAGDAGMTYNAGTNTLTITGDIVLTDDHFIGITGDIRIEFDQTDGDIMLRLGDAAGSDEVQVLDSGGVPVAWIDSNGNIHSEGNFEMVATTATLGQITQAGNRILHTYGTDNIFLGDIAGNFTLTGIRNVGEGRGVLASLTDGSWNVAIGYDALAAGTTADANVAMGNRAMAVATTSHDCFGLGNLALVATTTGNFLTAIGSSALLSNTTGSVCVAIGTGACRSQTTAWRNVGIMNEALRQNITGWDNLAIGEKALRNNTGARNIGFGTQCAQLKVAGDDGVYIGFRAGLGTGAHARSECIMIGTRAGELAETADNHILIGYQAGDIITTGDGHIIIGHDIDPTGAAVSNELNIGGLIYGALASEMAGVNVTPPSLVASWHVNQPTVDAAIPVLYLGQTDVSEEMIQYETTIGVGNAIEAVGAKTLTVTHFIKVTLPGGLTRYHQVGTIA